MEVRMRLSRSLIVTLGGCLALSACPAPEPLPAVDAGTDAPAPLDTPASDAPTPDDVGLDAPDAPLIDAFDPCANADMDGDGADSMACGGIDCDDADPLRAPGRPEICDVDDRDEDCDPTTFGVRDGDMDGEPDARCCNVSAAGARTCGTDCDDVRATVSPVAPEVCNGRDDDCNVAIDEGVETTYYLDADGNGFGVSTTTMLGCAAPPMYVSTSGDCVDSNRDINPARGEVCGNLIDDNCNMMTDETGVTTFYADLDGDMHGDPAAPMSFPACSAPAGWAVLAGDCDDDVATTYEGAPELCNRVDDDCSIVGGRGGPDPAEDDDSDGHAEIGLCVGGPLPADDCDDERSGTHPGATEVCNRIDDDCSLPTSPGGLDATEDADDDAHAPVGATCSGGLPRDDCRDADSAIHPLAAELCNRIDDNCSLASGAGGTDPAEDADDDAHAPFGTFLCSGGPLPADDCDDTRAATRPGASEICDAIDSNCDGVLDGPAATAASCTGGTVCLGGSCSTIRGIAAGSAHTCIVSSAGRVLCWGSNMDGRLGVGSAATAEVNPRVVAGITNAFTVTAGAEHTCVRRLDNTVVCWGANQYGQLGDGTTTPRSLPTPVSSLGAVTGLDAGFDNTCAIEGGAVRCWGRGRPSGSATDVLVPTTVTFPDGGTPLDVSAGGFHSCAVMRVSGTPYGYCWGGNSYGALGANLADNLEHLSPQRVVFLLGGGSPSDIEAGASNGWMIAGASTFGWGINTNGTVGEGVINPERRGAVPVYNLSALELTSGSAHACARRTTGEAVCWGYNAVGQLGDGTTTDRDRPTTVSGVGTISAIGSGPGHACATNGRALWCWGNNIDGQLGRDPSSLMMTATPIVIAF